jgi:hypothetical protein
MRYLLFLLFAVSACAPATSAPMTEEEREEVAEAIRARVDGYCDAALRKDLEWLAGFWANVDGFTLIEQDVLLTDYQQIYDGTADWLEMVSQPLYCEMTDARVYVLGPDAASATTNYEWGIETVVGDTLENFGSWTYVFDRIEGEFRVVQSSGNRQIK